MLGLDVPLFGRKPFEGFSVDRMSELYIVGDTRGCRSRTRVISSLIRRFHPDRNTSTTPTEVTKALNFLVEEIDAFGMGIRTNS
jgi:hypothetical protein